MSKLKIGMLALAASFMFQGAAVQPASAMPAYKPQITADHGATLVNQRFHGGHRFGGVRHQRFYGGHHFRRHHFYGPRFYIAPVYSRHSSCHWLKRKALYTGSHYWWRRYQHCRHDW